MTQVCSIRTFFVSFYNFEKRDKSVLGNVFFVFFYDYEKEIKVYSDRENECFNNMLLCSKHMEPT